MRSKLGLAIMSLFVIPLISAASWGGSGTPFDYFNNEWIKFTAVLVVLFALISYFVKKKTDNTPFSIIFGLGVALLLTIALTKRGILDAFLEETIVDWILIIAILAIIFFLFYRIAFKENMYGERRFSLIGFIALLIAIAAIPLLVNFENILPESIMYGPFGDFIELLKGASDIIFIGLALVIFYLILRRVFRGGRRVARGVIGAGRWMGRRRQRRVERNQGGYRSARQAHIDARRTNIERERSANRATWVAADQARQLGLAKEIQKRRNEAEEKKAEREREKIHKQKLMKQELIYARRTNLHKYLRDTREAKKRDPLNPDIKRHEIKILKRLEELQKELNNL